MLVPESVDYLRQEEPLLEAAIPQHDVNHGLHLTTPNPCQHTSCPLCEAEQVCNYWGVVSIIKEVVHYCIKPSHQN